MTESVLELRVALEAVAKPERAPAMAAYMKHRFVFMGVGSTPRRAAQRSWVAATAARGPEACLEAAAALWEAPEREFQYVGCDLLRLVGPRLASSSLTRLRTLVATKSWWDTVDSLAKVVGAVVRTHPELQPEMRRWVDDDDMWVARAAILHQLGRGEAARPEEVFDLCAARLGDGEWFIRKAIGWALRDLARTRPEQVWDWVDAHPEMSGLSRREACKHRP